jgi:hypothetical protein
VFCCEDVVVLIEWLFCSNLTQVITMTEEKDVNCQEFKLEPDCELRFEVESKNEKVVLEVS